MRVARSLFNTKPVSAGLHQIFRQIAFVLVFFAIMASTGLAQSESGSAAIEGKIADPNSQAIAGATVTIRNQETGYTRRLTTDGRGQFIASVMPVGIYVVEASAGGFATVKAKT